MSPRARARSSGRTEARWASAEGDAVLVERAELSPVPVGVLQVVSLDLVELGVAVTLGVDGLGPLDETLVKPALAAFNSPL